MVGPAALVLALLLGTARAAVAHPIHSTLTEITCGVAGGVLVRIRAFADDFSAAAARYAGVSPNADSTVDDAVAQRYLSHAVTLEAGARIVRLSLTSQRRERDVVWLELRTEGSVDAHALRLLNALLFDLHPDQVNVVQVRDASVRRTVLFSNGDGMKRAF